MNRRGFCQGLGLVALTTVTAPSRIGAQPAGKTFKMGLLATTRPTGQPPAGPGSGETVVVALRELGYVEGRNIIIERRYVEGVSERLPGLAAELVGLKPDVIFAYGGSYATALRHATTTIPVVAVASDMVAQGLADSVARPGRNVTGLETMQPETAGKRFALLKEILPGLSRVGLLLIGRPAAGGQWYYDRISGETQLAARAFSLTLGIVQINELTAFETAFAKLARDRVQAVLIPSTILSITKRGPLADLARKHRIASVGDDRAFPEAGYLMSYGPDYREFLRHAATFIDKILKGAKPGDLPIEQPTKLQLLINMKTAKAIGLTIPRVVLLRADEVIE